MLKRYALTVSMLAVMGFTSGCLFTAIPKHFPFPQPDAAPVKLSSRAPSTSPVLAKKAPETTSTIVTSAEPVKSDLAAMGAAAKPPVEKDVPFLSLARSTTMENRKRLPQTSSKPHARPASAQVARAVPSPAVPSAVSAPSAAKSFIERTFSSSKRSSLASLGKIPNHPVAQYSEFQSYLSCVHGAAVSMDDNQRPVGHIVRSAIDRCGQQKAVAVNALSYPGMTGEVVVRAVDNGVYTLTLSKLLSRRLNL